MKKAKLSTALLVGILFAGLCALEILYGVNNTAKFMRRDTSMAQDVDNVVMAIPGLPASGYSATTDNDTPSHKLSSQTVSTSTSAVTVSTANTDDNSQHCKGDLTKRDHYKTIATNLTASTLDMTDPIFRRHGWDIDPFVVESHKLLFFTVPKNSCTEWKRLFKRMLNHSDWRAYGQDHMHNPQSNGLKYLGSYPKEQQIEFMTSPEWTRAIFLRDPLQRLLSGYLEKAHGESRYVQRHCCNNNNTMKFKSATARAQCMKLFSLQRKGQVATPKGNEFPFATFVSHFARQCPDTHWAPQSQRLRAGNWKFINYVGYFDTLEDDARCLLEKIGAWEEFGASGWGKDGTLAFFQRNTAPHSTSAKESHDSYYTPDVLQAAWDYLKGDYVLPELGFVKPEGVN